MHIDRIPYELFFKIVNSLTFDQRLVARLVCKQWKKLIDDFKLKTFVICDPFEGIVTQRWFDTNERLNIQNLLLRTKFNLLTSIASKHILSQVNKLSIYNLDGVSNFEKILGSFIQVEKLDLYAIENIDKDTLVMLPNLMVICIDNVDSTLTISSNKLNKIKFFSSFEHSDYSFNVTKPETVKYLELSDLSQKTYESIQNFVNLKYLYVEELDSLQDKDDLLVNFRKLKELHFMNDHDGLSSFLRQKQFYNLNSLRIYFLGINLDSPDEYSQFLNDNQNYYLLDEKRFKFYAHHYLRLSNHLPFISGVRFDEIEQYLPIMSKEFFDKLTNLCEISISGKIENESIFFEFVKQLRGFPTLSLTDCYLTEEFFERLTSDCWYIQYLILNKNICKKKLNYNFLFKLKCLNTLRIEQDIGSLKLAKQIYDSSEMLNYFSFNYKGVLKSFCKTTKLKFR